MNTLKLEQRILDNAKRRTVYAKNEAALIGIDVTVARAVIRKLLRQKLIYRSDNAKPGYWGGAEAGYRAM